MSASFVLSLAFGYAQLALALAACFAAWRVLRGPRAQDRAADPVDARPCTSFVTVHDDS